MITGLSLSILLLFVVLAFYAMDFTFMRLYDADRQKEGQGWSWDYTLFTALLALFLVLQPALFPWAGWYPENALGLIIQLSGLMLIAASFAIHIWARMHLRKFYTERVEVQPDHLVIDTGPYAYVRHPIITSFFALALGLLFVNPALTSFLIAAYAFWDFNRAARDEEKALGGNVRGYADYMKRVPRFFPKLW
jgi:protein-S-isoprenylcysteine O-methyltransferase Ste14